MSIFASRTTKTIAIPFAQPHEALIQKLAGRHLQRAQQAFFNELIAGVTARGGSAVQKDIELLFKDAATASAVADVKADPLNGLDVYVICQKGIKTWTLVDDEGHAVPVTPETIDDLDEEAVRFFAEEIMRLTKPALFLTKDESELAIKNG